MLFEAIFVAGGFSAVFLEKPVALSPLRSWVDFRVLLREKTISLPSSPTLDLLAPARLEDERVVLVFALRRVRPISGSSTASFTDFDTVDRRVVVLRRA